MSSLFLRTLREDPADAEVPSHKLLVRAGYVRRVAPGIYSWLPLGLRVLRAVEQVVREEMDAIGAQEIQFPALLPREPYEATEPVDRVRPEHLPAQGPQGRRLPARAHPRGAVHAHREGRVRAPTRTTRSILYQIQTKYRDEERPRAGILRGREFLMKDSYSFDLSDEGLAESYAKHREAYIKIFDRLGLRYVIVSAMSGAMGGSASEEFLAESETGEDTFVRGPGGYAANVEAVDHPRAAGAAGRRHARRPGRTTRRTRRPSTRWSTSSTPPASAGPSRAADTLKNVLVKTRQPGARRLGAAGRRACPATARST